MDALGSITSQFDPRLAALLGWVVLVTKIGVDWLKTATTLPKWGPPAAAFVTGVVLFVLLMVALGIGFSAQLVAQAIILALISTAMAIGATVLQARTKPTTDGASPRLPVTHEACGGTAFYALISPRDRDLLNPATQAVHADGSPVTEPVVLCQTCGKRIEYAAGLNGAWGAV